MPTYEYTCDNCCHNFEIQQSFSEFKELKKCPKCKKNKLKQVFYPVHTYTYHEPTTLGHQACKNTEKMGKYELQDRRRKDELEKKIQRKKPLIEKGLIPPDAIEKERKDPWYGKLEPQQEQKIMQSKETAKKYIMEGK